MGTMKCKICGAPYTIYVYYAGDQSACPKCRAEASRRETWVRPWENEKGKK